jgi:hypothetical protein
MKITKRQLKRIINEVDAASVDAIISDIVPNVKDLSRAELELLDMKIEDLIAQLSEGKTMKITKRQLRRIIRESISSDRIYLDDDVSSSFGLDYDNTGHEWTIYPDDFKKMQRMNQYDTAHQKIFAKHMTNHSTEAVGAGYGWWELSV